MARESAGLLFVGGDGPDTELIGKAVERAELVIAADSGYDLACSLGVAVDLLVGDMDSIRRLPESESLSGDRILAFDRDKDETDTEIGLRLLHERGATDVTIVGGGGGRLDHLLAIMTLFERELRPSRWITANEEVVHIEGQAVFEEMRGVVCSFFPVGDIVCTMRTSGLKWPLDGLSWRHGDVGISNCGVDDRVIVTMLSGRLIMVRNLREVGNG